MPQQKQKELRPIKETPADFDAIEREIMRVFRQEIYLPLVRILGRPRAVLHNAAIDALLKAISDGEIGYYRGAFTGRFSSYTSRELQRLGANWDRKTSSYRLRQSELPHEVQSAITTSRTNALRMADRMSQQLDSLIPDQVAEKARLEAMFSKLLGKTERELKKSVKNITVMPELTPNERRRISAEYTNNLNLYITDFTEKETKELRRKIRDNVLEGYRFESMQNLIQESYGVSHRKAKFLARQETSLMVTKFKQARYEEAGVDEYRWACVVGSKNHPVRPLHKKNEGKVFKWTDPPTVNEQGERKNPGQDYNCRCFAIPIAKF